MPSFCGTAEHRLGRVSTKEEVADLMNAIAVARWFEDTLGIACNGLTSQHVEYLKLLSTRGAPPTRKFTGLSESRTERTKSQ